MPSRTARQTQTTDAHSVNPLWYRFRQVPGGSLHRWAHPTPAGWTHHPTSMGATVLASHDRPRALTAAGALDCANDFVLSRALDVTDRVRCDLDGLGCNSPTCSSDRMGDPGYFSSCPFEALRHEQLVQQAHWRLPASGCSDLSAESVTRYGPITLLVDRRSIRHAPPAASTMPSDRLAPARRHQGRLTASLRKLRDVAS